MKTPSKAKRLLEQMAAIERMERGKLCRMAGRNHYNLQAWRNGRNEVRYVREQERQAIQEAIDGYKLFMELAEAYADTVIEQTRKEHQRTFPKPKPRNKTTPTNPKKT